MRKTTQLCHSNDVAPSFVCACVTFFLACCAQKKMKERATHKKRKRQTKKKKKKKKKNESDIEEVGLSGFQSLADSGSNYYRYAWRGARADTLKKSTVNLKSTPAMKQQPRRSIQTLHTAVSTQFFQNMQSSSSSTLAGQIGIICVKNFRLRSIREVYSVDERLLSFQCLVYNPISLAVYSRRSDIYPGGVQPRSQAFPGSGF